MSVTYFIEGTSDGPEDFDLNVANGNVYIINTMLGVVPNVNDSVGSIDGADNLDEARAKMNACDIDQFINGNVTEQEQAEAMHRMHRYQDYLDRLLTFAIDNNKSLVWG